MNNFRIFTILFLFAALNTCINAEHGAAREFFATQYRMECSQCHNRAPRLNLYGQNFKDNGNAFVNQSTARKELQRQLEAKKEAAVNKPTVPPESGKQLDGLDSKGSVAVAPLPPPVVDTSEIFRWKLKDGGIYLTNNSMLRFQGGRLLNENEKGLEPRLRVPLPKRAVQLESKALPDKRQSQTDESLSRPILGADSHPRDFAGCMDRFFAERPVPANGDLGMQEFDDAEQFCAPLKRKSSRTGK